MNRQHEREKPFDASQLVIEAIDAEFIKEGLAKGVPEEITRWQLEESRLIRNKYDELFLQGYSEEQIDTLWEGRTNQEILALYCTNEQLTKAV